MITDSALTCLFGVKDLDLNKDTEDPLVMGRAFSWGGGGGGLQMTHNELHGILEVGDCHGNK